MALKIASRSSALALVQANIIKDAIEKRGIECEIVTVSTKGDRDRKSPINKIGGRGLFVKEIEKYLISNLADVAVHSGKDLPYELEKGLVVAGTPKAADRRDMLVIRKGAGEIKRIGTGSARRIAECKKYYPKADYVSIRGNVNTRLEKLKGKEYDAIILAKAGTDRLGADLSGFDVRIFSPQEFIPSACQGIIAAECRAGDKETVALLNSISDISTMKRFLAERYMLSLMKADCSAALGVYSELNEAEYIISAMFNEKRVTKSGRDYKEVCRKIKSELLY